MFKTIWLYGPKSLAKSAANFWTVPMVGRVKNVCDSAVKRISAMSSCTTNVMCKVNCVRAHASCSIVAQRRIFDVNSRSMPTTRVPCWRRKWHRPRCPREQHCHSTKWNWKIWKVNWRISMRRRMAETMRILSPQRLPNVSTGLSELRKNFNWIAINFQPLWCWRKIPRMLAEDFNFNAIPANASPCTMRATRFRSARMAVTKAQR